MFTLRFLNQSAINTIRYFSDLYGAHKSTCTYNHRAFLMQHNAICMHFASTGFERDRQIHYTRDSGARHRQFYFTNKIAPVHRSRGGGGGLTISHVPVRVMALPPLFCP